MLLPPLLLMLPLPLAPPPVPPLMPRHPQLRLHRR
jgi:hypothetical protein